MRAWDRLLPGSLTLALLAVVFLLRLSAQPSRPSAPSEVAVPIVTLTSTPAQTGVPGARCWSARGAGSRACATPSKPPSPARSVRIQGSRLTFNVNGPKPRAGVVRVLYHPLEINAAVHADRIDVGLPSELHGDVHFLLSLTWPQGTVDYGFWVDLD